MTFGFAIMTKKLAVFAELGRDIKLSHSLFALPFALLGMFLAAGGWPTIVQMVLIVWCMFFARTYAMLANRYVDRKIDADNPRTASRALPAGRVSANAVRWAMIGCGLALAAGACGFGVVDGNWWPAVASPVVLIWLGVYGLFKRFSSLAHFFLGGALALSPLAAGLAIAPSYLTEPTLWLLAGFVLMWVAGFDIIYALQDIDFDREAGLHSIPAKLGRTESLAAAKGAHLLGLLLLVLVYRLTPSLNGEGLFLIGIVIVGVLLMIEHRAASAGKFNMAFFTLNGLIALLLGGLGIAEILISTR